MKAETNKICDFLETPKAEFIIPIYQRNYDWEEEHCEKLLNDILEVSNYEIENGAHFIGSIVYISDNILSNSQKKWVIIDGQQRITTLTLLLIALYHYYKDNGDEDRAIALFEDYIINKRSTEDSKIKLKTSEDNRRDIDLLIDGHEIPNYHSRIRNNYLYFKSKINDFNKYKIFKGFENLYFVEICLERGKDNPQKIFESLNSTGLELSQGDLIRNFILMDLQPDIQEKLFRRYWSKIEENTYLNNKSHISNFIRDFLTLKTGEIPKKDKVYLKFKKFFHFNNSEELEQKLSEIHKYSEIYKLLIEPTKIEDKEIMQSIFYLNYIEVNVAYPFLLQLLEDYKNNIINKSTLLNILHFIETYITRRFILDLPTNALNKIFMILYKQVDQENYEESIYRYILNRPGKSRMPTDSELRIYLPLKDIYSSNSKMRKYIFENLENFNNAEKVTIINEDDITIEHIFPQNPESVWKESMNNKDFLDFKDRYLHTLGNLTLSGYNLKLSNKGFSEKQNMNIEGGEQGYKYSRMWLNRFLGEIDTWNIENYNKRSDLLTNRFISRWKVPHIDGIREIPETNIEDIVYENGMELEYAIFAEEKLAYKQYAKLYSYILNKLFELDEQALIDNCSQILKLSYDKKDLTRPKELQNYFYEANLSGKDIINNLQKILRVLGLSDELYIKFKLIS